MLLLAPAATHASAPRDTLATRPVHLSRRDALFALGACASAALAATQDRRLSAELSGNDSPGARGLAAAAKRLGDHLVIAPALLAVDATARLAHRDALGAASERIACSCAAAGLVTLALKESAGRLRPGETADPARFEPFSRHDSFPSGHTTMAFSLAAALDAETATPWVPALLYPAATLTAWSRVRDRAHWPSDVVAGAAIGGYVAHRTDRWARQRWPRGLRALVLPQRGGAVARLCARF